MNAIQQHLYQDRYCKKCKMYRNPNGLQSVDEVNHICSDYGVTECCDVDLVLVVGNIWWVDFPDSVVLCRKRGLK